MAALLCYTHKKHKPHGHCLEGKSTFWKNRMCATHPHCDPRISPALVLIGLTTLHQKRHDFLSSNTLNSKRTHPPDSSLITSAAESLGHQHMLFQGTRYTPNSVPPSLRAEGSNPLTLFSAQTFSRPQPTKPCKEGKNLRSLNHLDSSLPGSSTTARYPEPLPRAQQTFPLAMGCQHSPGPTPMQNPLRSPCFCSHSHLNSSWEICGKSKSIHVLPLLRILQHLPSNHNQIKISTPEHCLAGQRDAGLP